MLRALSLFLGLLAPPLAAQTLDDIVQLEVLPGWRTAQDTHMVGLQVTLAPGWKTYWRTPGDAGIPPQMDFTGSNNIGEARFHWPVPTVFDQNGIRSVGYEERLVLPVELTPLIPKAPMRLDGVLDIGICAEICIPARLQFQVPLPVEGRRDPAIVAALVDRPLSGAEAGLTAATCAIEPSDYGISLTATLDLPAAGRREAVVIEAGDPLIWVSEPDVARDGDTLRATVDMVHMNGSGFAVDRSAVRITVLGSSHAVDVQGCAAG